MTILPMENVTADLALQESDNMEYELKIQNNFSVGSFMKHVKTDFIFSYDRDNDEYKLMNDATVGLFQESDVNKLASAGRRVIVITPKTLAMKVYNIDKSEVTDAIMNM